MSSPHPTLTLILDIDKRLDCPELRQEVQRAYAYVGSTLVRTHEEEDPEAPAVNTMHLLLRLGRRRYLYSIDEGADELWNGFLEKWFYNAFHKLGNHMKIYNRHQREIDMPELTFHWIDLELQNGSIRVRMHTDSTSDITPDASAWLTAMRTALNSGALGDEIEVITMPSPASYSRQVEAGIREKQEREAREEQERIAAEEAARIKAAEAEEEADEAFLESPELIAANKSKENDKTADASDAEDDGDSSENAEVDEGADDTQDDASDDAGETAEDESGKDQPEEVEEAKPRKSDFTHEAYDPDKDYSFLEPDFPVDYSIWRIDYLDGNVREFDSNANAFIK